MMTLIIIFSVFILAVVVAGNYFDLLTMRKERERTEGNAQ
jgi:hypothetical protein